MALNIQQELEKLYQQNQTQSNSLSERLNQIDQYNSEVEPIARARMTDESSRPKGYNSLTALQAALEFSERSRGIRSAANEDLSRTQTTGVSLLKQLSDMQNTGSSLMDDLQKKIYEKQIDEGTLTIENGQLVMKPASKVSEEGQRALDLITEILPRDTKKVTGLAGGVVPVLNWTDDARTTQQKIDQLKATLALDARKLLKGSGPITEGEQAMLKESVAALKQSMSDDDFRKELKKIEGIIRGTYTPDTGSSGQKGADPLGLGL